MLRQVAVQNSSPHLLDLAFHPQTGQLLVIDFGGAKVLKVDPTTGQSVNSINGADGLIIDEHDNLWVAANQADEIVVVDPTGRAIAKLGDFGGIDPKRRPRGLLFPASLVRHGKFIYVTNLAIDLRLFDDPTQPTLTNGTIDSQWAAEVKIHTISKIRARIPRVQGLPMDDETDE